MHVDQARRDEIGRWTKREDFVLRLWVSTAGIVKIVGIVSEDREGLKGLGDYVCYEWGLWVLCVRISENY